MIRRKIHKTVLQIFRAGLIIGAVMGIGLVAHGCSQPVASVQALKILVDKEGIYRISAERLSSAGMDIRSIGADHLQLSLRGIEQSLHVVSDEDGLWFEFYGQERELLYSAENIYILNAVNHKFIFSETASGGSVDPIESME